MAAELDKIHIRDLGVRCIVGVFPHERREKQDIVINITMEADLSEACRTDDLAATVDYKAVKKRVLALVETSSFQLVERLAQCIAEACLEDTRVQCVHVTVDKPGALRFARSAAVEVTRRRE